MRQALDLGYDHAQHTPEFILPYFTSRGLAQGGIENFVIDLFGYDEEAIRCSHPAIYQWLLNRVKPDRDAKADSKDGAAYAKLWWVFGKPRPDFRKSTKGLRRFIGTPRTKHRVFTFLPMPLPPRKRSGLYRKR